MQKILTASRTVLHALDHDKHGSLASLAAIALHAETLASDHFISWARQMNLSSN